MLPSFLIIGAAKAATSTVWSILGEHPDVFLPEVKEPNYFLEHIAASRGLAWYESLYDSAGDARHRGESSNGYSMFPIFRGVPERAAALVPDARIIYIIRHPVRRMVSQWIQFTTAGYEHRPLHEALVYGTPYYFTSCYGLQLSRWARVFPHDALLVVRSEDLMTSPGPTIERVLAHLGLDTGWRPSDVAMRKNESKYKVRSPRPVRRVSGALRGVGLEGAAAAVARRTEFRARAGLFQPYRASEVELDPMLDEALLECFRADLEVLRKMVGSEMDLYGLA